MPSLTTRQTLLALAAFALLLGASGFILEYGFNILPCQMCWWQRYAHYAILACALLGLITPPQHQKFTFYPILAAALTGLGIAMWQFAAQHGWLPFPPSCGADPSQTFATADDLLAAIQKTKVIPCDKETFTLLGLSLAGWNIPAMLLVLVLSIRALKQK